MASIEDANLVIRKIDSVVHEYEQRRTGSADLDRAARESLVEAEDAPEAVGEEDVPAQRPQTDAEVLSELMGDTTIDTTELFGFEEGISMDAETNPVSSRLQVALYSQRTNTAWPGFVVSKRDRELINRWLGMEEVRNVIPIDIQFAWSTRPEVRDNREVYMLYVLKRKVQFLGRFLENIALGQDSYGKYAVDFRLSGDGAARFAQLTGANIDKPLAIALDGKVESAPFINSKIRRSGQITMGSTARMEDARNLEIVLKAGALPAPVEIIEKNVVGATLGADSISKGFTSALIGLALVLLFIGAYYRLSGIIADVGLLFNLFFLLAVMAGLGATLTMPGIAGIILTIGISVDANVLIFERIREELRTGKTVRASIDAGYERAFVAIFDSHVTTLITAGALFLLGSGPIKGFAVTLFWGVLISLYTAYVITKQIFDLRKGYKTLSI